MARTTVQPQDLSLFSTGALADLGGQKLGVNVDGTTISTNGSNQLVAIGGGSVPSTRAINTTAPLTGGGNLSADRTLAITQASSTTNGYLSSTDWNAFHAGGGTSFANPTATITLTPVNGTASTAMRSDAAPALSSTFSPTMVGEWTFSPTFASSSTAEVGVVIAPNVSQTGSASYTALTINNVVSSEVGINNRAISVQHNGTEFAQIDEFGNFRGNAFSLMLAGEMFTGELFLSDVSGSGFVDIVLNGYPSPAFLIGGGGATGNASFKELNFFNNNPVTNANGTHTQFGIAVTYNQSSTAGSATFLVARTDTSVGSGSQLFCDFQGTSTGSTRLFAVQNDGNLRISTSSTASVGVGTIAAKFPIYNAAGTLLGYIPIYSSIT